MDTKPISVKNIIMLLACIQSSTKFNIKIEAKLNDETSKKNKHTYEYMSRQHTLYNSFWADIRPSLDHTVQREP